MTDEQKQSEEKATERKVSLDSGMLVLGMLKDLAREYMDTNEALVRARIEAGDKPVRYISLEGRVDMRGRGSLETTLFSYGVARFNEGESLNAIQHTIVALAQMAPRIEGMVTMGLQLDRDEVAPQPQFPKEWTEI